MLEKSNFDLEILTFDETRMIQQKFEALAKNRYEDERKKCQENKLTFWTELAIIIFSLSIVPILMICVLLLWPATQFFVPVKIKE